MPMAKRKEQVEESKIVADASASANRAKNFLKKYAKSEFASTLSDSQLSNVTDWISSGSLSLNKVLSGSLFRGFANNRLYVVAGPSSTGKSLICARTVREAQKKGYQIFYYDSENAIDKEGMQRMGVDTDSLIYVPVVSISEFRNLAIEHMKAWREDPDTKDTPALFFCDSIGGLAGTKEINDVVEGKSATDMGQRAKELRAAARLLTVHCAKFKIPMICTNHTYEQAAANPQAAPVTKMTGGEGFMYAASAVVYLKKRQVKEAEKDAAGDTVKTKVGNVLIATSEKNRFVREGTKGEIFVHFDKGVSTYYGLLVDALEAGLLEKRGPRIYVKHLDKSVFESQVFVKEVFQPILEQLNTFCEQKYKFSSVEVEDEAADTEDALEEAGESGEVTDTVAE